MKKKQIATLLAVVGLALTSCGTKDKTAENQNAEVMEESETTLQESKEVTDTQTPTDTTAPTNTPRPTEAATGEIEVTLETINDSYVGSDGVEAYKSVYTYPIVKIQGNEVATSTIELDQNAKKEEFLRNEQLAKSGAESYYQEVIASDYSYEFYGPGYDKMGYELKLANKSMISFETKSGSYCIGGMQGNTQMRGLTYDAKTGAVLGLEDIFADGAGVTAIFKELLAKESVEQGYMAYVAEEVNHAADEILKETNWFFAEDGIHFIANEYVMTGFGEYREFVFSYDEIPAMKEEYKVQ